MLPPADEYLPQPDETGSKSADREQAEPQPITPAIREALLLAIEIVRRAAMARQRRCQRGIVVGRLHRTARVPLPA
jgi:hypothetical protein